MFKIYCSLLDLRCVNLFLEMRNTEVGLKVEKSILLKLEDKT